MCDQGDGLQIPSISELNSPEMDPRVETTTEREPEPEVDDELVSVPSRLEPPDEDVATVVATAETALVVILSSPPQRFSTGVATIVEPSKNTERRGLNCILFCLERADVMAKAALMRVVTKAGVFKRVEGDECLSDEKHMCSFFHKARGGRSYVVTPWAQGSARCQHLRHERKKPRVLTAARRRNNHALKKQLAYA